MKFIDWTKFSSLVNQAIASGNPLTNSHTAYWDTSRGCSKPYRATLASTPPNGSVLPLIHILEGHTYWIDIDTPCRKCEPCLNNRRIDWYYRMLNEIQQSPRTWFGTLTISPHNRFLFSLRSGSRNFIDSHREISKEVTKYFKRLRKAGYKFRYIVVTEAHKDGYPHLHLLVHELLTPITKRTLQSEWCYGFSTFKLVEDRRAAQYIAKYLAKDARTRIRASQKYGQSGHIHDLLHKMLTSLA